MTKKHYEAIANIYRLQIQSARRHTRKEHREIEEYADTSTAKALADYFAQDNPRFDRERFLKACGIETK